jgi:dipeptidyl aminopeptidase/acylaminoacyl peptidase
LHYPLTRGKGMAAGWGIMAGRQPSFSKSGQRLFFGTAPLPAEDKKSKTDKNLEKVKVDIWHYKDPLLQPMQLLQTGKDQARTYLAMVEPGKGQIIQLGTKDVPDVVVGGDGDGDVAVGSTDLAYRHLLSWDYPGYHDVFLIDAKSGSRQKVLTKVQGFTSLSPGGKYLTWWDGAKRAWFALSVKDKKTIHLTKLLPCAVHNELHDVPATPPPYGMAGWVKDDKACLIYDGYDIWAVDPESVLPPVCVTEQFGRKNHLRFRYEKLDPKEKAIDPNQPMLLAAFNLKTKATGYYLDQVSSNQPPQKLICVDEYMDIKAKAKAANKLLVTRSTFSKFPDLWVCDAKLQGLKQVSHANPQQKDYTWGKAELMEWTSLDGVQLNGLLYKPDNFDAKKQYPLLVYFYERNSENLHKHYVPAPSRSIINISFYVSRGYVVFVPDIPYKIGHPGQSCLNAVLPGVTALIKQGFVHPKKIGVQGHSWGGYQVAYLVTKTKLFAAAESGAPVSNMTSAYGGIRWSTGMSRMFQYEKSQSRIGGTLWNAQQKFLENSPLFWADQITTPLLILHNDKDGAVPWYQGIELFVALRRLDRPCWMLNYNGEDHGILKRENSIDFSIRMQQFFDHYLKGDPPPVWLANGVPATQKGKTLGLDLVTPDGK